MRRIFGRLIQIIGIGFTVWIGFVGGSFAMVYLVGFIGTGGREAGGELLMVLIITIVGIAIGLLVGKLGSKLALNKEQVELNNIHNP